MSTFALGFNSICEMRSFEEQLRKDLHQFLLSMKVASERVQSDACIDSAEREQVRPEVKWVDERMPECPDVEEKWEKIAKAYIPDGIREFQDFPSASLGWMMYIGMAVAKMWDTEWEIYSKIEDLYAYMRDKRKAKKSKMRIRETVLLGLAVLGGSIGTWLGMKVWHHKTLHKKFSYGLPAIIIIQLSLFCLRP